MTRLLFYGLTPRPTMKFRVLLEYDAHAGRWSAVFPDLPGCASAGDTEEEAVADAKEALALWLGETRKCRIASRGRWG